jgi:CHAT domain/Lecithin:cholesterol acyltransferase
LADDPGSPDPSQPTNPASPERLRPRAGASVGPPQTDADAVGPAVPSAAPYRLRGASTVSRSAPEEPARERTAASSLNTSTVLLRPKKVFVPAAARADLPRDTAAVEPDDLIEVEFDSGERLWMRGDDFRINFAQVVVGRDAAGSEEVEVPLTLPIASRGLETRGPVAWTIKGLKVFGVDLAGESARGIGRRVDFPAVPSNKRQTPGRLYRCSTVTEGFDLTETDLTSDTSDAPWLLFLHGTLSSTWGSFGELWSKPRETQLTALRTAYGDRIVAFEHTTLTESPVQNVRELAALLPRRATLHVVSHSRGGLVGELLCRAAVVSSDVSSAASSAASSDARVAPDVDTPLHRLPPFTEEEIEAFASNGGSASQQQRDQQLEMLRGLQRELQAREITVDRFVRVACPALGTTLASGRLDRWLSVVGTVTGAALPGSPLADIFTDIGDFIAAIVKQRTDPATLPGLEAQMPDSALIRLVNWPGVRVHGHLAVIAGDIDSSAIWSRLLVWLSDRFYEGDHDLVVNTPSMWGGARRAGLEILSSHKGPSVNHFSYFAEAGSAERLVAALTIGTGTPAGFEPLRKPTRPIARAVVDRGTAAPRPVVFVLPGMMGSELADATGPVWVALLSLLRGGLGRLDIAAAGITATEPLRRYYSDIIEHLSATHTVVPFAYDWRVTVSAEADRLAAAVRERLAIATPHNQPVRFLAHSMGGLVVRAMIARHPAVWQEICAHPGGRLVMLGTPNGGSHAITELLVGRSVLLRKLARLDIRNSRTDLLRIIGRFPGVLAMLPVAHNDDDYFSAATWRSYHTRAGGADWPLPTASDLQDAAEVRRVLDSSPTEPQHMVYVAGSSDVTIAGMRLAYDPWRKCDRIEFLGTTRGDGRVTWDSGIPPSVPTWYMDVEHGDLANHPPAFAALHELLTQGTTRLLDQRAPVTRAVADLFPMPPAEDDRFPDEEDLTAAVVGAGSRKRRTTVQPERPIAVSVVHGNLAFARHVIAVGHYAGDTIISAEQHLDRALEGALTRRHQMGLYPGPIETSAIFTNPRCNDARFLGLRGALVVGLGAVGSLSAAQLSRSFARALLEYALERSKSPRVGAADSCPLGVSALLIGTGAGGMSVGDSVYALIRGAVRANETLTATKQTQRISTLEFVELWEDRAVQALEALHMLSEQVGIREAIDLAPTIDGRDGGLRRLSYNEPAGWWQRLQILGGSREGELADGGLRFAALTGRARTEVRLLSTQRQLVDQYIEGAIASTRDNRAVARTLFDLLLPNELKESAPDQDNVVLLLDEESARYPWELLEDGSREGRKPWVIEHGLLRQLESQEFRSTIHSVAENSALVIGDPVSSFLELKGAQAEAEAVWRTLQGSFVAAKHIRPTAQEVVSALFARPYKLLHLAGHGVYRYLPQDTRNCEACGQALSDTLVLQQTGAPVTGMVIGDGVFLTPAEVQQMRRVPDLVFINCCYLGLVEAPGPGTPPIGQQRAFPRLAANVATEFIRMGVRAVVAAGWAVDDAGAATFSTVFYDEMLKGHAFGEAVKLARCATFERHPGSNTWGAYQCYGDPEYRLTLSAVRASSTTESVRIVSPAHAVQDLSNIAARLKTRATASAAGELERIEQIAKVVEHKGWLQNGLVTAALARAYGEAGQLDVAIPLYRQALAAEDAAASMRDVEQLANFEVRHAMARWQQGAALTGKERDALHRACVSQIEDAIKTLETLGGPLLGAKQEPFGQTAERLALIASAYKRLALMQSGRKRLQSLEQMETFYRKAAAVASERQADAAYPLLNAVAAALARRWQRRDETADSERDTFTTASARDLSDARVALARQLAQAPAFRLYAMSVDADLLGVLAGNTLSDEEVARIATSYLGYRAVGSAREVDSVFAQFDFLYAMARDAGVRARLEKLRDQIRAGVQAS